MDRNKQNNSKFFTFIVALFFMATPLDYVLPHIGPATVLLALGLVISFMAICFLFADDDEHLSRDQFLIVALVGTTIISIIWAKETVRAANYTFSFAATAVMYCLLFSFKFSKDEVRMFEKASIIGGLLFAAFVFTQVDLDLVRAGYRLDLDNIGSSNNFSDPNGMAARLIMPTALMIKSIFESKKKFSRLLCISGALAATYIILLSGSRAATISLAAICTIVFMNYTKNGSNAALIFVFIVIVIIIYIPEILPEHIYDRIFSFSKYQEVTTLEGDRIDIWKNVILKVFPTSPIIGHGAGNACVALSTHYGGIKAVHNSWLTILADLGLVGFIPWMSLVYRKARKAFRIRKQNVYVLAIMLGTIIMATTLDAAKEKYLWNAFLYAHLITTMYMPNQKDETTNTQG